MRHTTILLCLLILATSELCLANMVLPRSGGTKHAATLSSQDVAVLHESILIKPEHGFAAATFDLTYVIETGIDGLQIPLLFIARNYAGDFHLTVDNKRVLLLSVPDSIVHINNTLLSTFAGSIHYSDDGHEKYVFMTYDGRLHEHVRPEELKYFQIDMPKGVHRINLTYNAELELDRSDWTRQYRPNYPLRCPAISKTPQ